MGRGDGGGSSASVFISSAGEAGSEGRTGLGEVPSTSLDLDWNMRKKELVEERFRWVRTVLVLGRLGMVKICEILWMS